MTEPATGPSSPADDAGEPSERPLPDIAVVVADVVRNAPELTAAEVLSVLRLDQRSRWQQGNRVAVEDYLRLLGTSPPNVEWGFELVCNEFLLREELGETPDRAEYLQRFPQYHERLRQQLEQHQAARGQLNPPPSDAPQPASPPGAVPAVIPAVADRPTVPGYDIQGVLGRGAMGTVYKALQYPMRRLVALKVIHRHKLADQPLAAQRFQREAVAAARLNHPNIVTIYEAGQAGDLHFITMECIDGTDLQSLFRQRKQLPVDEVCEYIRQAALGLQHAHEKGLVHRDIKPSNLLLVPPRKGEPFGVIKILDLGTVRVLPTLEDQSLTSLTLQGEVLGTPNFMAPEQVLNPHGVDIRADLYSLGCTFYYLLTGRLPFPGRNAIETLDMHRWLPPRPVNRFRSRVPPAVVDIVQKLMAKRPDERFPTPADLVAALERAVAPPDDDEAMLSHEPAAPSRQHSRPWFGTPGPVRPIRTSLPGIDIGPLKQRLATLLERNDLTGARDIVGRILRYHPADEDALAARELLGAGPPAAGTLEPSLILEGHQHWVLAVAFTKDGQHALSGSQDHGVRLWELQTGKEVRAIPGHSESVRSLDVSPDGRLLLTGSEDRTVRLWELETGRELRRFLGWCGPVNSVAFAPDGRHAASGSRDRVAHVWDLTTGKELRRFKGHTADVYCVGFAGGGRLVLSGSRDSTLRMWKVQDSRTQARFANPPHSILSFAVLPDDHVFVGCSDGSIHHWDFRAEKEVRRLPGHPKPVTSLALSPDGRRLLSGSTDQTVRLWDVATGAELLCLKGHTDGVSSVAFSPDGTRALSGSLDQTIRLWTFPG